MKVRLEVCVDSLSSAKAAYEGGCHRIELCSALSLGGLTPSIGLLLSVKSAVPIPVVCMIRCRNGNFVYSNGEVEVMLHDVEQLKKHGADGFVFGALNICNGNCTVDRECCEKLLQASAPLPCTFHRAIDLCSDWRSCLETIMDMRFQRVLTSGLQPTALAGLQTIKEMRLFVQHKIIIMPGSGINAENVAAIVKESGCEEVHASCSTTLEQPGSIANFIDPSHIKITDRKIVQQLVSVLRQ